MVSPAQTGELLEALGVVGIDLTEASVWLVGDVPQPGTIT
jgi:hypothetical protein